jgi:hypothetical protein
MPEQSSEPEKYSIDEMMGRLKGGGSSGKQPELVTRPDGSQAMKVRKRKRRTKQAVSDEAKRRHKFQVVQIAAFVILVVLMGLAAGIAILYANSSGFRESLLGKLEDSSGAKVGLNQFRMNPATANANMASFGWPEGNALAGLELHQIRAKIAPASFLGSTFSGEEIVAGKGQLSLRAPGAPNSRRHKPKSDGMLSVKFQRYWVPEFDIRFGDSEGSRRLLKATEASFFPSAVTGQAEVRLRGGLFEFDAWPLMELDRSYIKAKGDALQIQSMRFVVPKSANDRKVDKGFIDFTGSMRPLEAGATHTLRSDVRDLPLPYMMGPDLGRFFVGSVDTMEIPDSNFLSFSPDSPESAMLELTLTNSVNSRIDLGSFKFLSQLSTVLDDRWYEFPNFDDIVTLVTKMRGDEVSIEDINLVSRGRMTVRGSVSNQKGGGISGKLRIGLPDTMIAASDDKRLNRMFGQVREGYRWLDLKIGGTSAVPGDNFKELYMNASVPSDGESTGGEDKPDQFENLIEGGE